jgi:hypothetical protein
MTFRQFFFIAVLLTAAVIAGSGPAQVTPNRQPATPAGPTAPEIVDLHGLRNVSFGDTEQELTRRGVLSTPSDPCGPVLVGHRTVSPIFAHDRLVLLWVSRPVSTPEGITDGTPVSQVRASYPAATRLTAPRGTYRFDGLLARRGDRAYLFLHDGRVVRQTIAGYAAWARRLFDEGHGPC